MWLKQSVALVGFYNDCNKSTAEFYVQSWPAKTSCSKPHSLEHSTDTMQKSAWFLWEKLFLSNQGCNSYSPWMISHLSMSRISLSLRDDGRSFYSVDCLFMMGFERKRKYRCLIFNACFPFLSVFMMQIHLFNLDVWIWSNFRLQDNFNAVNHFG